jgi:hypothetical protein
MLLMVFAVLALSGCESDSVMLKNPQTSQVIQCHAPKTGSSFFSSITNSAVEQCVQQYEAAGWQRMN